MLLETLDIKKNDVLIYSQNISDLEENFKIIFKDDPDKTAKKISYGEVCRFVNEFSPKNLIVYRLLTNIPDFEIFLSKYGFFLNINSVTELIYFDPVFAVKELQEYSEPLKYDLRFRIQQVGLTTLNRFKNLPNYAEIYSVDLQAAEAKHQNDKVFADALFSVEKEVKKVKADTEPPLRKNTELNTILNLESIETLKEEKIPDHKQSKEEPDHKQSKKEQDHKDSKEAPDHKHRKEETKPVKHSKDIKIIRHDLSEDKDFDIKQIMKINYKKTVAEVVKEKNVKKDKPGEFPVEKKKPSSFGSFLQNKQINLDSNEHVSLGDIPKDHLTQMFKSPSSLKDLVEGKEDKKVVLKLNKE